ncbi:protein of unknown function; putative exported protein [Methylorubrum extorquens DM4]|uniref:Uncharacterized protein n=1 Tax=Methylorubrum extorquens (strain DSM 6343 / CIP 106787 / DM4) TaxID=661410 RepID=C7CEZ1_METED|nr:protein of unknown function; putative exported protein [Methylorubrum extorquens DM4]
MSLDRQLVRLMAAMILAIIAYVAPSAVQARAPRTPRGRDPTEGRSVGDQGGGDRACHAGCPGRGPDRGAGLVQTRAQTCGRRARSHRAKRGRWLLPRPLQDPLLRADGLLRHRHPVGPLELVADPVPDRHADPARRRRPFGRRPRGAAQAPPNPRVK